MDCPHWSSLRRRRSCRSGCLGGRGRAGGLERGRVQCELHRDALAGGGPISLNEQRGATSAPPGGTVDLTGDQTAIGLALGPPINQDVRVAAASAISTSAAGSAARADAKASATDITITTPAGPLVIDGVSSSVSCPVTARRPAHRPGPPK